MFKDAPPHVARDQAIAEAERHLESGFKFPDYDDWSPAAVLERLADSYHNGSSFGHLEEWTLPDLFLR